LEIDVYVQRYALLAVLARNDDDDISNSEQINNDVIFDVTYVSLLVL